MFRECSTINRFDITIVQSAIDQFPIDCKIKQIKTYHEHNIHISVYIYIIIYNIYHTNVFLFKQ